MRAEAEREVRQAAAPKVKPVGLRIGARIAVGRVHQEEHAIPRAQRFAMQRMRLLDDANLGADRAIVAQQFLDCGRSE